MKRKKKGDAYNIMNEINSILKASMPIKRPTKKQMNWTQAKARYPKLNPLGNADGDLFPNVIDCKPFDFSKQDFTPFRQRYGSKKKEEEMTAAERFGGANIKRLKKLGAGRDRVVYALDKDKVLKVAKNPGGLRQNYPERDLDFLNYLKHHETGKDYVVMEKAEPIKSKKSKEFIKGLKKQKQFNSMSPGEASYEQYSYLEDQGHGDLRNFTVAGGDVRRKANWGEKDGEPVLIDAGTLVANDLTKPHTEQKLMQYRNKLGDDKRERENYMRAITENEKPVGGDEDRKQDIINMNNNQLNRTKTKIAEVDNELQEWQEIKRDRQLYKDKGTKPVLSNELRSYKKYPVGERPEVLAEGLPQEDDSYNKKIYEDENEDYETEETEDYDDESEDYDEEPEEDYEDETEEEKEE